MIRREQRPKDFARKSMAIEYKRQKWLGDLAELARVLVVGGTLGGLGAGTVIYGLEKVVDMKYQAQYEQIADMEAHETKLEELFGNNYPASAKKARQILERKKHNPREGLSLLFGTKPDDSLTDSLAHEPETEKTERTITGTITTRDGRLNANIVSEIVQRTMPKGWVNNEVERIEYEEVDRYIPYEGIQSKAVATCYRRGRQNKSNKATIIFHKKASHANLDYIVKSLGHEMAHANDWESDNEMTDIEKAALALQIGQRLKAKDRFVSSYVESIEYGDDEKQTRYSRAVEYWAEICEQYFKDATRLHIKDYRIVDAHIRKTDSSFNWKVAATKRQEITRQIVPKSSLETSPTGSTSAIPTQP